LSIRVPFQQSRRLSSGSIPVFSVIELEAEDRIGPGTVVGDSQSDVKVDFYDRSKILFFCGMKGG
jgi:hypothetical protein